MDRSRCWGLLLGTAVLTETGFHPLEATDVKTRARLHGHDAPCRALLLSRGASRSAMMRLSQRGCRTVASAAFGRQRLMHLREAVVTRRFVVIQVAALSAAVLTAT